MKLKDIYKKAIRTGISVDPRGEEEIIKILNEKKKEYNDLSDEDKRFFDKEKLENPYADTRILCGNSNEEITGIITGIDLEVGEVLLADRLNQKGENINLLLAHHPEGNALASLGEVMGMQADIWNNYGVPVNIGDVLIDKRSKEVQRSLMPVNHNRAIDAARLLGFNYMSIHTPADNLVTNYLQNIFDEEELKTVKEIISRLKEIPEYQEATKIGTGPSVLVGDKGRRAGKIFVEMTGGTEGPKEIIEKLADAGVGTIVGMHMGEKLRKKAEEFHINVVIAGHIASDAVGLNLFLDEIKDVGIKIITCSGFIRVERNIKPS